MSEENEEKVEEQEVVPTEETKTKTTKEAKKGGHTMRKIGCFLFFILLLVGAGVGYFRYYYPFADGVKSGTLNYITRKGYVFKTWEGKLIQDGLKSGNVAGSIQNNEFEFSVSDDRIAKMMELVAQNNLQLHYTEYLHALPWRGFSKYVVDSIISVNNVDVNVYMQRLKDGNLSAASKSASIEAQAYNNGQTPTNYEEALQQLRVAQEQIKALQQQLNSLQQNMNNNQSSSSQQRFYQQPSSNSRRTDDGQVFEQNN